MELEYISPSALNEWHFCNAKWNYHRLNVPELPTDDTAALFGTAVHRAISHYYDKISDYPRPIEIQDMIKQSFADHVDSFRYLKQKYESCLTNFINFEIGRLKTFRKFKPTFTERTLRVGIFKGIVDAYWQEDETVLDWKTGWVDSMNPNLQRQGAIYRNILNEAGFPCKRAFFIALTNGRIVELPNVTQAWVEEQVNSLLGATTIRKNVGPHCNYCPYNLRCQFSEETLWSV